jgi:hypothetical protein
VGGGVGTKGWGPRTGGGPGESLWFFFLPLVCCSFVCVFLILIKWFLLLLSLIL